MLKADIRDNIIETLCNVTLGSQSKRITQVLSTEEIFELANMITVQLPEHIESILAETKHFVLDVLEQEEQDEINDRIIKDLMRLFLSTKINKEQLSLLIFYLINAYTTKHKGSITKELINTREYFYSHILHSMQELERDVAFNEEVGRTRSYRDGFIRVREDYSLIPSEKTLLEFTNYLYNFKKD